ncbi:MAG: hypothetical protein AAB884_00360 [Patescibacteria group bacterium]
MSKDHKNYRQKLLIATIISVVVFVSLQTDLFVSLGLLNHASNKPQLQLNALNLAALGMDSRQIEKDVNRMIANMSNAQQGSHFFSGVISGLVFSQPWAGLTVGLIKESVDFTNNYRRDQINREYFIDATIDTIFWALGGYVGFYLLTAIYEIFRENKIRGPKDLIVFLGKKTLAKKNTEIA